MTNLWDKSSLDELATIVGRGITPKYADDGDYLVINQRCVREGRVSFDQARRHTSSVRAVRYDKVVKSGDIMVNSTGVGTLGRTAAVAEAPELLTADSHITIVRPKNSVHARWLSYAVSAAEPEIEAMAEGSTGQTELSRHRLALLEFRVPPLPEQRAIAATLGALDDKIESNRRAIEALQRLSAAAFTRWRNEAVTVVTSTFGAYADVYGGATPKTTVPDYWGGGLAWTTPTDVTGLSAPYLSRTSRTITNEGLQSCTAVMHPAGTIFMTSRATIGAFAINQIPAATNQGFIAVRPKQDADRYFLYEEMRSRVDEFLDNANGSTFLEISRGRFKELPLEVPEPDAIALLDEQVGPLHRKATQLALESDRLTALRDALLPELLSGRVRALTEARP